MATLQKKSFTTPDETHTLPKCRVDIVTFGDMSIDRGIIEPGWKWSEHFKPIAGTESAEEMHFSYIVSGHCHIVMDDGTEADLGPGDMAIVPPGHDVWVVGDEPLITLDIQRASRNS